MNREKTIDRLRGVAMLWVIVVHVLYWGNFFSNAYVNLWKSFCLFEMPLFFFITGASNSFSKINDYIGFVSKRFHRVLVPYWIFAIICIFLSIIKYSIEGLMGGFTGIKIILSWMIPIGKQMTSVPYLTWALWFIPVYLCVILIIPFLRQMSHSKRKKEFVFILLGVFCVTCFIKIGWIQQVAFYSFWTYIGLFYREIKSAIEQDHVRSHFLYIVIIGIIMICILYFSGQTLDMQSNKFPPNIMFLVFSVTMMTLIIWAIPYINKYFDWLENYNMVCKAFNLFSTRSMTIFLYQVFAFNLTIRFSNLLMHGEGIIISIAKSFLCLITTILACSGFAIVFGKIEKI